MQRNAMREWIESEWGARVVAWAVPADECTVFYEVIVDGEFIRAESVPLLIAALNEARCVRFARLNRLPLLRLVA
jgi:hypothetical protein